MATDRTQAAIEAATATAAFYQELLRLGVEPQLVDVLCQLYLSLWIAPHAPRDFF